MLLGRFLVPDFKAPSTKKSPSKRVACQVDGEFLYIGTGGTNADKEPVRITIISSIIHFQIGQGIQSSRKYYYEDKNSATKLLIADSF